MKKVALWTAAILAYALTAFFAAYFVRGSLEMFPTAEQQSKVRSVCAAALAPLIVVDGALLFLLRRNR